MYLSTGWNLAGRSAVITADYRGWTPFLASALAEAGADLVIVGSEESDMMDAVKAARNYGTTVLPVVTDITIEDSILTMLDCVRNRFNRIDILVNNALLEFAKPFDKVTSAEWETVMEFNVFSRFLLCRLIGKHMLEQGGGRIINIESGLSVRGMRNAVAACASQGAIHQMTSALALEWANDNIRVNGIGSGWISTSKPSVNDDESLLTRYIPSKRRGHPNDLCGLLVYLGSDACDFLTGQTIFIDGGVLAHA